MSAPARMLAAGLSCDDFLAEYWQHRPLLIRQAQLSLPHRLDHFSLWRYASDARLGSRLVSGHADNPASWQLSYGPFGKEQQPSATSPNWTLLVQDLDKVDNGCKQLLDQFDFLPRWRLDDVMASYAVPGGSVGPHIDQYDVFLIQLHGKRRWLWGQQDNPEYLPDLELRILQQFNYQQEAILQPGDILYLPPGIAHHGIAIDACLTLSVGLRTPANNEWLHGLVDHCATLQDEQQRYRDPDLAITEQNQLGPAVATRLRRQLQSLTALNDQQLLDAFGRFITQYRLAEELLDYADIADSDLSPDQQLQRHPAARLTWQAGGSPDKATLYTNGMAIECAPSAAQLICNQIKFRYSELQAATPDHAELYQWLVEQQVFCVGVNYD